MKHCLCALLLLLAHLAAPVLPARAAVPVPVPPSEQAVPLETAQDWLTVSPQNDILEGAIFDGEGNLL